MTTRRPRSTPRSPSITSSTHIAVWLALLSAGGCCSRPSLATPAPQCEPPSTEREIFVGLYSIYYRAAHLPATGQELGDWKPAPLETAARYLRCDPDRDRRRYRIRYATIKLAASAVILQRTASGDRAIAEFTGALAVLGIPETLVKQLADSRYSSLGSLEDDAGRIIDSKPADDPLAALQRTCCPCLDPCQSGTAAGGVAVVEFTISVNRDAQCLAHVVDPQCWKKVLPLSFNADPQVVQGPCTSSTPPDPTCRSSQTCNVPQLPAPTPISMPPTPATPWCGLLLEDVAIAASGVTANTKNVLGVRTTETASPYAYQMDYKLCETREWSVISGTSPSSGVCSIELDCGNANVGDTGATGNAKLSGTKRIRFTSQFPNNANSWAPTALEVLATETATAACVPSSSCPAAGLPAHCTSTAQGSTSDAQVCRCDKAVDHCDGPFDSFMPAFVAPSCPLGGAP